MIRYACKAANDASIGEYTHENGRALVKLKTRHGIEPQYFSDEILSTVFRISDEVVRDLGQSDAMTAKIYDSYIAARESYRSWTEMGDGRYIAARGKALSE